MADSAVPITAGTGTNVDTFAVSGGDHQQIVREARATAVGAINSWTVTSAGQTSQIAADASRVKMLMVSMANGRIYLRFDATLPTSVTFHWFLDPEDRWEVPEHLVTLAVSMLGAVTGGTVLTTLATAT